MVLGRPPPPRSIDQLPPPTTPLNLSQLLDLNSPSERCVTILCSVALPSVSSISTISPQLVTSFDFITIDFFSIMILTLSAFPLFKMFFLAAFILSVAVTGVSRRCPLLLSSSYMRLRRPWVNHFKLLLSACEYKPCIVKVHALIISTGTFTHDNINGQLITTYTRIGYLDEVLSLCNKMILEGVRPDSSIFTVALKACTRLLDLKMGEEIWSKAVDCGYGNDVFVGSSVLNMLLGLVQAIENMGYSRLGLSIPGCLIRKYTPMDVIIQTSLVDMYAKIGYLEHPFRVFSVMTHKNVISWGAMISGLAQNGFAGKALGLLVEVQSDGYPPDLVCLIRFKDAIFWNVMISTYGVHGQGEEALSLFLQMIESNVKPDHATFAALLSGLSHSGLVEEVWVTILAGCYNYAKFSIGEKVEKKILELNLDDQAAKEVDSDEERMADKGFPENVLKIWSFGSIDCVFLFLVLQCIQGSVLMVVVGAVEVVPKHLWWLSVYLQNFLHFVLLQDFHVPQS
ncbi:putative pentatricopeptide repeat-containing protein [Senna tora]|uniref:Putative pentatricopeptide repeat-containing protein n=1 Tax=Senna tora TaxID=362788 RepID=A0A834T6X8_9FABA|nr:putative pentatricopeptide repeat-containing protein [Senna tora]